VPGGQTSLLDWLEKIPLPPAGHGNERRYFRAFRFLAGMVFVSMAVSTLPSEVWFSFPVFAFRFHFRFLSFPVSCL
jgi:hypothetical protein